MEPIKLRTWVTWAAILFIVGVAADYYFLHILFHEKKAAEFSGPPTIEGVMDPSAKPNEVPVIAGAADGTENSVTGPDNFLENLKKCAPEIAAQTVSTPEALLLYLRQSIGVDREETVVENIHFRLPDGIERRVQVLGADNTNTPGKKELRYFKLDNEGKPERLAVKATDTVESLVGQGSVFNRESRKEILLKDKSSITVEEHNSIVFEFQYNNHGKVLSCRLRECQCP